MQFRLLTAVWLIWNMTSALTLRANGGGYVEGLASTGAFKPLGVGQVEMVSEHLEIDLHIEYADVTIEYELHNPGPKVTVEAGFPSAKSLGYERDAPEPGKELSKAQRTTRSKLEDFDLRADETKLKVTTRADDLHLPTAENAGDWAADSVVTAWHIFRLDFEKGQTRKLHVHYRNPYHCNYDYVSDDERVGPLTLTYLFSSAASWSGPIKKGTVILRTVSANPQWVQLSHPKRFHREGNQWTWNFTDFKPTLEDDLVVTVRPGYFGQAHAIQRDEDDGRFVGNRYVGYGAKLHSEDQSGWSGRWELQRRDYLATASSTLAPHGKIHYDAKFLAGHDSDSGAWAEGVKGDGIGESVTLTLPKPAKVKRVAIINGYSKSKDLYFANNRVAELAVSVNGGPASKVTLPDECLAREQYYFNLPPSDELVKTVKLTIAKVYKGSRHDDTCISEVALVVPLDKAPEIRPAR